MSNRNTKFTPGPWELIIRSQEDGIWGCIGALVNRDTFCRVDCANEEKTANARLIAAAPELLDVAYQVLKLRDAMLLEIEKQPRAYEAPNTVNEMGCLIEWSLRAIAKATGGAE